jgi:hypothetical protein
VVRPAPTRATIASLLVLRRVLLLDLLVLALEAQGLVGLLVALLGLVVVLALWALVVQDLALAALALLDLAQDRTAMGPLLPLRLQLQQQSPPRLPLLPRLQRQRRQLMGRLLPLILPLRLLLPQPPLVQQVASEALHDLLSLLQRRHQCISKVA